VDCCGLLWITPIKADADLFIEYVDADQNTITGLPRKPLP